MNKRYVTNLSLHHRPDGKLAVSAFILGTSDPVDSTRRVEYVVPAPDASEDDVDWLRQALAAAVEGL